MNAAQAQALSLRGAALRASLAGVAITCGGLALTVPVTASEDSLDLETGGFDRAITLRFRFPVTFAPPAKGAAITVTATGQTYYVTESQALPPNTLAGDYIVEARRK